MLTTLHAVYENQSLRLDAPLPLKNGETIEITLELKEQDAAPRKRFSWEDGPVLSNDSYAGNLSDEVRRQRDEE